MRSPVYRYSRVLMIGPSNGQNAAPPSPATSPTATCGSARYADSDISRMSHNSATLQPNPTAGPLTAAMIGSGKRSISSMICEPSRMLSSRATGSSRKVVIQFRSPPAQNARPAPVSTTTLASLSAASCRQTLASAQCRFSLTQLSSAARLTTTVRTGPSASTVSSSGRSYFMFSTLPRLRWPAVDPSPSRRRHRRRTTARSACRSAARRPPGGRTRPAPGPAFAPARGNS